MFLMRDFWTLVTLITLVTLVTLLAFTLFDNVFFVDLLVDLSFTSSVVSAGFVILLTLLRLLMRTRFTSREVVDLALSDSRDYFPIIILDGIRFLVTESFCLIDSSNLEFISASVELVICS